MILNMSIEKSEIIVCAVNTHVICVQSNVSEQVTWNVVEINIKESRPKDTALKNSACDLTEVRENVVNSYAEQTIAKVRV